MGPPGDKGLDGAPGRDGINGQDGQNGTLEQLRIVQDEEQDTATFVRADGTPIEGGTIRLYRSKHKGTYEDGTVYTRNQRVMWRGSEYSAIEEVHDVKPDHPTLGARFWRLTSMRGKQGKDGKPGPPGPAGPKGDPGPAGRNAY
jgi:hypothetical protein